MWGSEIGCEQDVWDVFYCYVSGEHNKNGMKVRLILFRSRKIIVIYNLLFLCYFVTGKSHSLE